MYKLTVETESLDELYFVVSQLRGKAEVTLSESEAEKPVKKTRAKKEDNVTPVTKTQPEKEETEKEEESESNADIDAPTPPKGQLTYSEVSKLTMDLVRLKGKPAVLEVLKQFGAANAPALKPEQWKDYVALVKLHLKEAP